MTILSEGMEHDAVEGVLAKWEIFEQGRTCITRFSFTGGYYITYHIYTLKTNISLEKWLEDENFF